MEARFPVPNVGETIQHDVSGIANSSSHTNHLGGILGLWAVIGAANLSEVLAKLDSDIEANFAAALLESNGVKTEPVTQVDARMAASMKKRARHLSLGDRLCIAIGERLDAVVMTADRAWGTDARIRQIR